MRIYVALGLSLGLAPACSGCGEGCSSGRPSAAIASSSNSATKPEPQAQASSTTPSLHVSIIDDRVTLECVDAPLEDVLLELSKAGSFAVEGTHPSRKDAQLTLSLSRVALADALAAVLKGSSYTLEYGFHRTAKRQVLNTLRFGSASTVSLKQEAANTPSEPSEPSEPSAPGEAVEVEVEPATGLPDDIREMLVASQQVAGMGKQLRQEQAEIKELLTDDDPSQRARAVYETAPIGAGAGRLGGILLNDPDADVRASAAFQLSGGQGYAVTRSLVQALDDDSPTVVIEAVKSLAGTEDPSVIDNLLALLDTKHGPAVKDAVHTAIDHLGTMKRMAPSRVVFRDESAAVATGSAGQDFAYPNPP